MFVVQNIRPIRTHTLTNEPYEHREMAFLPLSNTMWQTVLKITKANQNHEAPLADGVKIEPLQNMHVCDMRFAETNDYYWLYDYWQFGVFLSEKIK